MHVVFMSYHANVVVLHLVVAFADPRRRLMQDRSLDAKCWITSHSFYGAVVRYVMSCYVK